MVTGFISMRRLQKFLMRSEVESSRSEKDTDCHNGVTDNVSRDLQILFCGAYNGLAVKSTWFKLCCPNQQSVGSKVVTPVSKQDTWPWCLVLWMGRKAIGPVCCITLIKEPSTLIEKWRGSPRCSWFNWQHTVPKHLVNHYMVLFQRSRSHNSNVVPHTLQEILYVKMPWASLSDGYANNVRSHYYN